MSQLSAAILARSPVGYWRMAAASGTEEPDLGSAAVDGEYVNTPTLGTAGLAIADTDTAVTFAAASSEHMAVADNDAWSLNTTNGLSGFALINPTTVPALGSIIGKAQGAAFEYIFGIVDGGFLFLNIYTAAAGLIGQAISAAGAIVAGTTYSVGFTASIAQSRAAVYINGISAGSATGLDFVTNTYANGTTALAIGADNGTSAGNFFNGIIDEAAIFPSELTAAQMRNLHEVALVKKALTRIPALSRSTDSLNRWRRW